MLASIAEGAKDQLTSARLKCVNERVQSAMVQIARAQCTRTRTMWIQGGADCMDVTPTDKISETKTLAKLSLEVGLRSENV